MNRGKQTVYTKNRQPLGHPMGKAYGGTNERKLAKNFEPTGHKSQKSYPLTMRANGGFRTGGMT